MTDNCGKCIRCLDADWVPGHGTPIKPSRQRMVVCQYCGNKRCPCATDHHNPCTGSNMAGQPGSIYA